MSAFDGRVCLAARDAIRIKLVHLLSGLDEDGGAPREGAMATAISGYTEWVSSTTPRITIGWDWEMLAVAGVPTLRRLSAPRSNILLDPAEAADLVLGARVDAFDWQSITLQHLLMHFSK